MTLAGSPYEAGGRAVAAKSCDQELECLGEGLRLGSLIYFSGLRMDNDGKECVPYPECVR